MCQPWKDRFDSVAPTELHDLEQQLNDPEIRLRIEFPLTRDLKRAEGHFRALRRLCEFDIDTPFFLAARRRAVDRAAAVEAAVRILKWGIRVFQAWEEWTPRRSLVTLVFNLWCARRTVLSKTVLLH